MDAIRAVSAALPKPATESASALQPAAKGDKSFFDHIQNAVGETNRLLVESNEAAVGVAEGSTDPVDAVLALSKAEVALRHTVSLSQRMLEAYREVMRLQL